MENKKYLNSSVLFIMLLILSCSNENKIVEYRGIAQGSTYFIKLITKEKQPNLQSSIDSILEVIDLSMSTYRPESLISKINEGENIKVDKHFATVVKASQRLWQESNGLFDPTVGILVNAWGFGKDKQEKKLTQKQIDSLLLMVGLHKITLTEDFRIKKQHKDIFIDFNAIAQGYTVDVIADFLKTKNIHNFIVEVGGELYLSGHNILTNKPWIIGIDNPVSPPNQRELIKKVQLTNKGLATSGNYRKTRIDTLTGKRYVHSINPLTGEAQQNNMLSATVIAQNTMLADGYATALMVMGYQQATDFLNKHPDIEAMLIYNDENNKIAIHQTSGFEKLTID